MLERALGLLGHVDLALLQALDQIVWREIDELDGVGAIEHRVRHGLAHAHMRDLRDHVVEALDMLDIDGGINVDSVSEQLFDVEVALGMAAAGHVGVGEFVDQHDLGVASDDGVEIHLLERLSAVFEPPAGNDLEPFEQGLRFLAPVGFDDTDDDIVAVLLPGARLLQHLVRLADAGGGADEDLEPAGLTLFAPGGLEQGLRRRSLVRVAPLLRHQSFLAAYSVCSPPPCGEGMGVGVLQRITARPPPRRFAPTLPTRGRVGPSSPLALDYTLPEYTLARRGTIERQVERQHVHPRLAQEAEGTTLDMLLDELPHTIFRQVARLRNTGDLEKRSGRRNVRIEAAAGGGYEIDGDGGRRVLLLELVHIALYALDQRLVGRA